MGRMALDWGEAVHRTRIVARWPVGMGLAAWRYMWRTTPVYRRERTQANVHASAPYPIASDLEALQRPDDGVGPIFHRRYRTRICGALRTPGEVITRLVDDPNRASPVEIAVFRKTRGSRGGMEVGDEYLIRMPGPWDGPVRVVDRSDTSFRFATLRGHLEAGQIEFRLDEEGVHLIFEVESWARSGDRLSHLLYDRLRMAKEMQLHMWTHFSESVARMAGGRMTGGVEVRTDRYVENSDGE